MDYDIRIYGDGALRRKAAPVSRVDDEIRQLVEDMLATMRRANGLGLAAEQIGRNEAICVIDVPPDAQVPSEPAAPVSVVPMPLILVNPRITASSGEQMGPEGRRSFPDIYITIKQEARVTAETPDTPNRTQTIPAVGLLARAIQHELDHLNGVLLVDHMTSVQKVASAGKLKRMKKTARCAV